MSDQPHDWHRPAPDDLEHTRPLTAAPPAAPPWPPQPFPVAPRAGSGVPGWIWPVVAGVALVVGLIGGGFAGALAGLAISDVRSGDGEAVAIPTRKAPPLPADNTSLAAVARKVLPSTVQIIAGRPGGQADLEEGAPAATGSGFVFDDKGRVVTNNHVVADVADEQGALRVIDNEGNSYPATIIGRSPVYDLALLDVPRAKGLPPAALGSSRQMYVGETVLALGAPLGLSSSVTAGILSALDRPVTTGNADESSFINALQTDAAINPGNSGGPLVNLQGEVVGVNSAIATMGGFGTQGGNIGVGFAIPVEQVRITAAQILKTGEARYPIIGATVETGGSQLQTGGARIEEVQPGTPAQKAGLQSGDVVTAVDDKRVGDGIELIVAIRTHQPGETITLTIERDGRERSIEVTLDSKVG